MREQRQFEIAVDGLIEAALGFSEAAQRYREAMRHERAAREARPQSGPQSGDGRLAGDSNGQAGPGGAGAGGQADDDG